MILSSFIDLGVPEASYIDFSILIVDFKSGRIDTRLQLLKYYPPLYVREHLVPVPKDKTKGNQYQIKGNWHSGAPDFNHSPVRSCNRWRSPGWAQTLATQGF